MSNPVSNPVAVGHSVVWQDTCYLIKAIKPALGDIVLEAKGGIERTVDLGEFYNFIASGDIVLPHRQIQEAQRAWTETEQREAEFRLALIELLEMLDKQSLDESVRNLRIDVFCQQHQRRRPSNRTINGYRYRYRALGFAGLIPNFSRRGGSGWEKKKHAKEVATQTLIETFMKDDKVSLSSVSVQVNDALKQLNQATGTAEKIDRKTIARLLLALPKSLVKEGRLDPRTFALWNRQAVKRYDVKHPFERVEIDAKTIDVYCCDEFGNRYSELTLYAMVCACTSYPIAVYVTGGKPSEYTLLKLFEFAFTPKDDAFKKAYGLETDWVRPCAITCIVFDNAVENASDLAKCVVRRLGKQIEYARIARGDDKPHAESLFKVMDDGLFSKMPGAKNSSDKRVKNRHARAEAEACYSVSEIYRQVVKFIADVYIHKPRVKLAFRHGKPMSIKSAMDEGLAHFMPLPPPSVEQIRRLILDLNRAERQVQHYGVDFEGFQFHSAALAELARERVLSRIELLFNPEDCTTIYAVHPDDGSLIRLDNKMIGMPSVSFATAKALKAAYSGNGPMTGHDYQRIHAQMLAQFAADSRRRPRIKANNRAMRQQGKLEQKAAFVEAVETVVSHPTVAAPIPSLSDDDDFLPAPRQELSHDR